MVAFFWLAVFPMILGGILLAVYLSRLRGEGKKSEKPERERVTPEKFISEVAQYSNTDNAKAEKMIELVFSYFPGFDWRKNLPIVTEKKTYENKEKATKTGEEVENEKDLK